MGKPNVIILGGLNVCSKSLASFLAPPEGESLVENLRIIDKFSVAPATTYIGPELPKTIARPNVEYRQANLTIPETVRSVFDPPEGQAPYDYVFDFTGETRHDRPDEFHIKHTFTLSRLIGQEAARRNVKAYIRLMHPFYDMPDKGVFEEKDDLKPEDVTGHWWHETLRTLAAIENLNLVILRMAFVYGPYVDFGQISSLFQVAGVYGYMKQPMRALHSPGKHAVNTVHVYDVVGAAWAAAEWIAPLGREQANAIAGEPILFKNDKKKVKDVEGVVDPERTLTAPLFNIVDDNETTWVKAGTTATAAFGTTFEFFNLMVSALAKFKLEDQVEDINQHHVGAWNTMVSSSNPTVVKSPLTAYMDLYDLQKHVVSLSNAKIKRVMNYQLKRPEFGQAEITEFIEKAKGDRIWPNV